MNGIYFLLALSGIAFSVGACASKAPMVKYISPQEIARTSRGDRPQWTTKETFFEEDEKFIYTGGVMGGSSYELTLRLARAEATKNLLESIQMMARSEFSAAMHGNNRPAGTGRYVTDAVSWAVDNLRISGMRQRELYYEQVFDPLSQSVQYNVWTQLEISKADYARAKIDAAKKLRDKTIEEKDEEAGRKAEALLERLVQGI